MVNEYMDFRGLKEILDVTDGNLASHAKALEQAGYITVQKQFIGRKPNTRYIATSAGKTAFRQHLNALEKLINRSE